MRLLRGDYHSWVPPQDGAAVAVGVFDGVHRGHQAILERTKRRGVELGNLPLTVLTFDPHPLMLIDPDRAPLLLSTVDHRLELLETVGVETCAVLDFDEGMRALTPDDFAGEVLVAAVGATVVTVGSDFRFGSGRVGDVEALRTLGLGLGYYVEEIHLVGNGAPVSSTTIRTAIGAGDTRQAAAGLGRWFELRGEVVQGERRGDTVGFPTANIEPGPELVVPGHGVYAVLAGCEDERRPGVANIGVRPTFGGSREVVEVHLLDFSADLYGRELRVQFIDRLREERRFADTAALAAQIRADIEAARQALRAASISA
ncbi:MAG: bifunctional riboflavin kinase/FAD synthetase [Acidimicrobiia bacterium]